MPNARSRNVNFRVTDDEFEELQIACDRNGARCLSAFARQVMLSPLNSGSENSPDRMAALDRRLSVLEVSMSRLSNALAGSSTGVNASEKYSKS